MRCLPDFIWQTGKPKTFSVNDHLVCSVVIDLFVQLLTKAVLNLKICSLPNVGVAICETGAGEDSGAFSVLLCVKF